MAALAYCALVPADQPLRGGKVVTITTPKGKGRKDTTVYPDEVADPCHGNPEVFRFLILRRAIILITSADTERLGMLQLCTRDAVACDR